MVQTTLLTQKTVNWLRIPTIVRYFFAIVLVQAITAVLMFAALRTPTLENNLLFAVIGAALGLVAALWLSAIATSERREVLVRARERLSREREKIRVQAEKEKNRVRERTQKRFSREGNRKQTKTNLKMGAYTAGLVAVGAVLLVTQFISLGVLVMGVSGGTLAGYLWRARQERVKLAGGSSDDLLPHRPAGGRVIGEGSTKERIGGRRLKG